MNTSIRPYEAIGTSVATSVGTTVAQITTTDIPCSAIWLKAGPGNSGTIYIGNGAVGTASGFPMVASDVLILEVANANRVSAIATAASQDLRWFTLERY